MLILAKLILFLVAIIHGALWIVEMFYWESAARAVGVPRALREHGPLKGVLGSLGLHNGFLAAGLMWGIFHNDPLVGAQIAMFFASFVAIAGLYNFFASSSGLVLLLQTFPAAVAVLLLMAA